VTDVSACFSKTRDYPPKIQAQGKVQWVCAQQARRRTIELTVDSPFVLQCEYEVDIQMGDTPEVPQPDSEAA
jgi:flagellar assembly factor FliW